MEWLQIALSCKTFNQLPRPGGVLDQRPKEMQILNGMMKVITDYEIEEQKKAERIARAQR